MRARIWPIYALCAIAGLTAYAFLSIHTHWTLLPHIKTLSALFGFHFYAIEDGYQAAGSGLAITQTCSGVNLFISTYIILVFGFLHYFQGGKKRAAAALVSLAIALGIAFIATLVRIILSLPFCKSDHFKLIHTVLSLCVFFGTGICVYWFAHKAMKGLRKS